jgi:sulfur carrier protein
MDTVKLTVNGEAREVPAGTTVVGLLDLLGVRTGAVAVEINAQVVRRAQHPGRTLASGDQVEIVTFVGGG